MDDLQTIELSRAEIRVISVSLQNDKCENVLPFHTLVRFTWCRVLYNIINQIIASFPCHIVAMQDQGLSIPCPVFLKGLDSAMDGILNLEPVFRIRDILVQSGSSDPYL